MPVQVSATSQAPAALRQTLVEPVNVSAGHAADEPVQLSARSHTPVEDRQTVDDGAN